MYKIFIQNLYYKIKSKFISCVIRSILLPIDQYVLNNAAHILAISINMKTYLMRSRKLNECMITVVENWQNESDFIAYKNSHEISEKNSILSFMYLGNIGPVAGVEFLIHSFVKQI